MEGAGGAAQAPNVEFVIEPTVRFEGQPASRPPCSCSIPPGNALEFKAMADPANLFAKN